jgi:hypothetical protein
LNGELNSWGEIAVVAGAEAVKLVLLGERHRALELKQKVLETCALGPGAATGRLELKEILGELGCAVARSCQGASDRPGEVGQSVRHKIGGSDQEVVGRDAATARHVEFIFHQKSSVFQKL